MRKHLIYFLFTVLFFSCQQELHFEDSKVSAGSLKKDTNGNCLPINVGGTYIAGRSLGDTNYIDVEVSITATGTYLIRTDTINGYSFKATGSFANTGSYRVKLTGSGIPIAEGSNHFTVHYDTSICHTTVNVLPVGGFTGPAAFTLQGAPNGCNATVTGSYVKNIATDTASKVTIGVVVTTPGTYSISTNTVNGYSFSGSGTLSSTGLQTITLTASGMPVNQGTDVFTVSAGASACTFSVTVLTATVVTNNDYFPLTVNSHWTYGEFFFPVGDSVKRKITDSVLIGGKLYKIMEEQPVSGGVRRNFSFEKTVLIISNTLQQLNTPTLSNTARFRKKIFLS